MTGPPQDGTTARRARRATTTGLAGPWADRPGHQKVVGATQHGGRTGQGSCCDRQRRPAIPRGMARPALPWPTGQPVRLGSPGQTVVDPADASTSRRRQAPDDDRPTSGPDPARPAPPWPTPAWPAPAGAVGGVPPADEPDVHLHPSHRSAVASPAFAAPAVVPARRGPAGTGPTFTGPGPAVPSPLLPGRPADRPATRWTVPATDDRAVRVTCGSTPRRRVRRPAAPVGHAWSGRSL